jgi:type I restriction enzyme S subunit
MSVADWKPAKLDELGFVGRGKSRHRPRNAPFLYGGHYPFFQTGDIKAANFYLTEYLQTYSDEGLAQSKLWKPGTLCITIAANIAESAILGIEGCFPDSVVGFVADPGKADVRFIKYYMEILKLRMQNVSHGATQDNLSVDKLLSFDFLVPPLPIQQRIAGILSAYDELIENSQRRIRILEAMSRALYRETLRSRTPVMATKPIVASAYWRFLSENVGSYAGMKRYYATADVDGLAITGPGIEYSFTDKPSRAQKQPIPYSVWFARMKDTYKIVWYGSANEAQASDSMLSSGFAGFEARDPDLWPLLFLTISSKEFHVQKDLLCTGATQMSLTNEGLARIEIPLPEEESARRLGRTVGPMLNAMLMLQQSIEVLRRARDLLLPRLLSGQVEVEAA